MDGPLFARPNDGSQETKIKSTIHCRTFQYKVDSNVSSLSEYELCSRRKKCIKQRTWPEAMM